MCGRFCASLSVDRAVSSLVDYRLCPLSGGNYCTQCMFSEFVTGVCIDAVLHAETPLVVCVL